VVHRVRTDCEAVARDAASVSIDTAAIARWAESVDPPSIVPAQRPPELLVSGTPAEVANWTLLLDCLNFCFWTLEEPAWTVKYRGKRWGRYAAMAAGIHRAVTQDWRWLHAEAWRDVTLDDVERIFAGAGRIPLIADRVRILNETGEALLRTYDGQATRIAETAELYAYTIADLLARDFPSFRDISEYRGRSVAILKRAQIFAANLAENWARTGGPVVRGLENLTAFADYRIPQALRHLGILQLESGLAARIESKQLIAAGSAAEVELRACSVYAVQLMTQAVHERRGAAVPAWKLDEYLWHHSHDPEVTVQHHRTLTCFY
jgi:hypothetical protein